MRLAFVAQATYFHYCALEAPAGGAEPPFFDSPEGAAPRRRAGRFLPEPIPRDGSPSHPDLDRRLIDLQRVDAASFDRIVSFDPLIVPTVEELMPVWQTMPIPVADRYFAPVAPPRARRRVLFTGRSPRHSEALLRP